MRRQSGNFLLQALLGLTLVFAFLPFFVGKLASRDMTAKLYSVKELVDTAQNAARIYLTEVKDDLPYPAVYVYSEEPNSNHNFLSTLTKYGLPLGFNPKTIFNQYINFVIEKQRDAEGQPIIYAYLKIPQGNMSKMQLAELTRMIGVYAIRNNNTIKVYVPIKEEAEYQEVVLRQEPANANGFQVDLDMGFNSVSDFSQLTIGTESDGVGDINESQFTNLIFPNEVTIGGLNVLGKATYKKGLETSKKITIRNRLDNVAIIGKPERIENMYTSDAEIGSFYSTPNTTVSAANWHIKSEVRAPTLNVTSKYVKFVDVNVLAIDSKNFDIETKKIYVGSVEGKDSLFSSDQQYKPISNVNPGDVMEFDDFTINDINWKNMAIIENKYSSAPGTKQCIKVLGEALSGTNVNDISPFSLIGMILCKYIFLERLERRIKAVNAFGSGACH